MRYAFAILLLLVVAGLADACNVPVFRYALERWHADSYRVTLFHRGPLTAAQQAVLEPLNESAKPALNVSLRMVDVDQLETDGDRAMYAALRQPTLPWLVVQYPQTSRIESLISAGPLDAAAIARLNTSPLRQKLTQRLATGQTAVWLMLECGDATKDDRVAQKLEAELAALAQKLKLPELTASPDDSLLSDAPLKIEFSLLRVPRNSPDEQPLVELLLHAEPDLKDFAEPMVFPVFGRGRALLPLIGAGITTENIQESASFLVGACSCEIKELNPGFDLLLAADWQALLFRGAEPPETTPDQRLAATGEPVLVAIPPGTPSAPRDATDEAARWVHDFHFSFVEPSWLVTGAAMFLLAGGFFAVRRFI
ncbi:MAG: hypothetical protein JNM18_08360 [Planctomycetaceae bacterium]|nr:hypothetical protein [Planctomycetaceae bacterium]